jgi:hypothetical protein
LNITDHPSEFYEGFVKITLFEEIRAIADARLTGLLRARHVASADDTELP